MPHTVRATSQEPPESKWKPRHLSRIYDYNYKIGQSYYNPQTDYIGSRPLTRSPAVRPPEAQTYAERFATNPIYGRVRGLPYDESQSVFNKPLAIHVSGTRSRASSLSRQQDPNTPTDGSRMLNRRRSLFDAEDDDFTRTTSYNKQFNVDPKDFEDPLMSTNLRHRIREHSNDLAKPSRNSLDRERTEFSFKTTYGPKGEKMIKQEKLTVSRPEPSTYRRSSIVETYDSKPPMSLRSRRSSIGSGEEITTRSSIRTRKYSDDSSSGLPPRPMRSGVSFKDDDTSSKFASATSFRDARKIKDSEELTETINKMVNKMKSHHLEDASADICSISRNLKATSLDPFEDDGPRSRSRQRARLNQFTYGVGKY